MEVCISGHDGCAGRIASTFMSPAPITRRDSAPQQRVGPAGELSVADVEPTCAAQLRVRNNHDTVADNTTRRPTSPATPPNSIVRQHAERRYSRPTNRSAPQPRRRPPTHRDRAALAMGCTSPPSTSAILGWWIRYVSASSANSRCKGSFTATSAAGRDARSSPRSPLPEVNRCLPICWPNCCGTINCPQTRLSSCRCW